MIKHFQSLCMIFTIRPSSHDLHNQARESGMTGLCSKTVLVKQCNVIEKYQGRKISEGRYWAPEVHTHVCVYVCIYINIRTHTHTHTYTHACIDTGTHIHRRTHTLVNKVFSCVPVFEKTHQDRDHDRDCPRLLVDSQGHLDCVR